MVTWDMENRIEAIPILPDDFKEKNNELWGKYLSAEDSFLGTLVRATTYGPYLDTTWDQGHPVSGGYNDYCPYDPYYYYNYGYYYLCVVGCVATAMAQIVNYHQYPSSVTFTSADNYSYPYPKSPYPTMNFDIASSASISNITYPASTNMAARLSYACGVSAKMGYSATVSGAYHKDAASAYKNKFGYTSATAMATTPYWASAYEIPYYSNFTSILRENLRNSQPTQLGIKKADGSGTHSIVCDGYIHASPTYYHLNYGWGNNGSQPGTPSTWWYILPSGMPDDYRIIYNGILDIKPTEPTGQSIYVDPSGSCNGNTPCYTTIQSAIDAASSGSVIKILAGTYAENLDLDSSNNYELQGGWSSTYSSQTSTSSVSSMTFGSSSGTITVGGMVVQ